MFDADTFMSAPTEGEMSTDFTPIPENEYLGLIDKVDVRETSSEKGNFYVMDVTWKVDDEAAREATGLEMPTVRQSIFLDLTGSGGLDTGKGKNVQLGRLREAVGQNGPGPWAPSMLVGNVATISIKHRMYEGRTFADVKSVVAPQ